MKTIKIFCITLGVLFFFYLICSMMGFFSVFKVQTLANEPAQKQGEIFFTTNLIDHNNNDLIVYGIDGQKRIHRLIAQGGDRLEIVDGVTYVNGKNVDKEISLMHTYKIKMEDAAKLNPGDDINPLFIRPVGDGTAMVFAEDKKIEKLKIGAISMNSEKGEDDPYVKKVWGKYNKDFFGPVTVPKGKIFVMGDNRDNSEDSRYIGYINEEDIYGVIIN